jgi:hypothetical protein
MSEWRKYFDKMTLVRLGTTFHRLSNHMPKENAVAAKIPF